MPDISLLFQLQKNEVTEASLAITKARRKKSSLMIVFIAVIGMVFTCMLSGKIYSIFLFGLMALVHPLFAYLGVKKRAEESYEKSLPFHFPMKIEFYRDHFVKKTSAESSRKSNEEFHFPFETVKLVYESRNLYIFMVSALEAIPVPKRAFQGEDKEKIENLIKNLFKLNYQKV